MPCSPASLECLPFEKANNGMRPNFMAVGAYDGMALIYQALAKTKGDANGDALLAAMKGMSWTSPRGKVERKDGALYNVEFSTIPNMKDPYKGARL